MKHSIIILAAVLSAILSFSAQAFDSVYYLVRHAEKQDDGTRNPSLTNEGLERAKAIADTVKGVKLDAVYSTNYKRTLETAGPSATQHHMDVSKYDPRKLKEFAEELKHKDGNYLIVGHSNTTPVLASFLSGEKLPMLTEKQYDRVYVVTINSKGEAQLTMQYTEPRTK